MIEDFGWHFNNWLNEELLRYLRYGDVIETTGRETQTLPELEEGDKE